MSNAGISDAAVVQYVVEVDGNKNSEHVYFVDAMKTALILRQAQPNSKIKVRDLAQPESAGSDSAEIAA